MGQKYTNAQILDAIKSVNGMVYLAARSIGCDPQTIYNRMNKYPTIRQAVDNARGEVVDIAEQKFRQAITNGEPWAVAMALKTLGKNRGYVERSESVNIEGKPLTIEWIDAEGEASD